MRKTNEERNRKESRQKGGQGKKETNKEEAGRKEEAKEKSEEGEETRGKRDRREEKEHRRDRGGEGCKEAKRCLRQRQKKAREETVGLLMQTRSPCRPKLQTRQP